MILGGELVSEKPMPLANEFNKYLLDSFPGTRDNCLDKINKLMCILCFRKKSKGLSLILKYTPLCSDNFYETVLRRECSQRESVYPSFREEAFLECKTYAMSV